MKRSQALALLVAPLAIAVGASSQAALIAYTSLASWQAAAGTPIATEDFADTTLVAGLGITFGNDSPFPSGSISGGTYNDHAMCTACVAPPNHTQPKLTFAGGTSAFGAEWDLTPEGPGAGLAFLVTFADATTATLAGFTNTFSGFYGFVSTTTLFTSVTLQTGFIDDGETFAADNVRFKTTGGTGPGPDPTPVPEPGTLSLFGMAALAAGLARRLNRRRQA